mmetsp:Transcript_72471/g.172772  ORF Transcript_72471/g.172772 Transcript_72471/m.172772 type:complete len:185 (-) Transcript_72471:80-634(-)
MMGVPPGNQSSIPSMIPPELAVAPEDEAEEIARLKRVASAELVELSYLRRELEQLVALCPPRQELLSLGEDLQRLRTESHQNNEEIAQLEAEIAKANEVLGVRRARKAMPPGASTTRAGTQAERGGAAHSQRQPPVTSQAKRLPRKSNLTRNLSPSPAVQVQIHAGGVSKGRGSGSTSQRSVVS